MPDKILVVEDEPDIAKGLSLTFKKEGFDVIQAESGERGFEKAIDETPNLVLLDIMLPGMNGLDVCRGLRQKDFDAPIVFLTARCDPIDVVVGLEVGANDYVVKPFNVRELVARIRARLRERPAKPKPPDQYRIGSTSIDFAKCRATRKGKEIEFTPRELAVLRLLVTHKNEIVTRDQMLNEVWGYDAYPTTRTVDMHILRLRQKLEKEPSRPRHILSMYGSGYKFVE